MSGMDAALGASAAGMVAVTLLVALGVGLFLWARRRG
jgi:nitrogen fixation-related uncharacterized protein